MGLETTEAECAAVAVAPRVSLRDIEEAIVSRYHFTAGEVIDALNAIAPTSRDGYGLPSPGPIPESLKLLSICIVVMKNGFTVIGKSACASPANFNADLGRKIAYEDAICQIWPLMGFALRERFACEQNIAAATDTLRAMNEGQEKVRLYDVP
jgi:hypothetical protein